jgi:hypothetical protein
MLVPRWGVDILMVEISKDGYAINIDGASSRSRDKIFHSKSLRENLLDRACTIHFVG